MEWISLVDLGMSLSAAIEQACFDLVTPQAVQLKGYTKQSISFFSLSESPYIVFCRPSYFMAVSHKCSQQQSKNSHEEHATNVQTEGQGQESLHRDVDLKSTCFCLSCDVASSTASCAGPMQCDEAT